MPSPRLGYEDLTYPGGAFSHMHPARHSAVARLLGFTAPDLSTARVLELGCAQGRNLLPLAANFPHAHFTGVDLSPSAIAEGRALGEAAELKNVDFVEADLCDFRPEPGSYDFILAHGLFSWVPDEVKAALLGLCATTLSPEGLACISYNTYPGWKHREPLRDLLKLATQSLNDPISRLRAARERLNDLQNTLADRDDPYALFTRQIIASMLQKAPEVFYHDELGEVNDPCYLLQFTEWAGEHDLRYVADADFSSMFPASDLLAEQQLDIERNRSFRCTLLTHSSRTPSLPLAPASLRGCSFGSPFKITLDPARLKTREPIHLTHRLGESAEIKHPIAKAAFALLGEEWPRRVPFPELATSIRKYLASVAFSLPEDFETSLLRCLFECCSRGMLDFLVTSDLDGARRMPSIPRASPLLRVFAERRIPVVTPWHDTLHLDSETQKLLAGLDGARGHFTQAESTKLAALVRQGVLSA